MSLSSYITHPTEAGPGGPPAHRDGPPDHRYPMVAKIIFDKLPVIVTIQ